MTRGSRRPITRSIALQLVLFLRRDEREGLALHLRAARTTDAVNVILRHQRHVEIDDVAERLDVDAAGGDVGRDEHGIGSVPESRERRRALRLRAIAVDALGLDAAATRNSASRLARCLVRVKISACVIVPRVSRCAASNGFSSCGTG